MTNKYKRSVIAHEFGHAVYCVLFDDGFIPSTLVVKSGGGMHGYVLFDEVPTRGLKGKYSKFKEPCFLGGIFGEMVYQGTWEPWGARNDLDTFITLNKRKKFMIKELNDWMWMSNDEKSFRSCSNFVLDSERRKVTLDSHDTSRLLPDVWSAYKDFCDQIDKDAFNNVVNELCDGGVDMIEDKELMDLILGVIR